MMTKAEFNSLATRILSRTNDLTELSNDLIRLMIDLRSRPFNRDEREIAYLAVLAADQLEKTTNQIKDLAEKALTLSDN